MSYKQPIRITEENFAEFAKDGQNIAIVMLYALSKYHEKYKVTEWCMKILTEKGFEKQDLKGFDKHFIDFYHQMLNQDDL